MNSFWFWFASVASLDLSCEFVNKLFDFRHTTESLTFQMCVELPVLQLVIYGIPISMVCEREK